MFQRLRPAVIAPVVGVLLLFGATRLWAGSADAPADVGLGDIAPCWTLTNCVSSLSNDASNSVAPLICAGTPDEVAASMLAALEALPRTTVVTATTTYVHAEVRSLVFGFVDDVEMRTDPDAGIVQIRSASRLGSDDLGANDKRVALIRRALDCDG